MDLEEPYMQEGEDFEHYVVFSKALSDKPLSPIGNRNLNIKHSEEEDTLYLNKKINELYGEVYNENQFKIKKS